jgi:hypothetical protein
VSGGERRMRGERGTLTSRGRIREEGSVHVAQTDPLSTGSGWREKVAIHVAQMGTLRPECLGEERERDEGGKPAPAAPEIARKSRFPPSHLLRRLGKPSEEGPEFAGAGSEGRGVSPIVSARVSLVALFRTLVRERTLLKVG